MKAQKQTVEQRHTALMKYAKRTIPNLRENDDPFGDSELFDQECARYFAVEWGAVIDPDAKWSHRMVVETSLFGGKYKHLHGVKYEEATNFLQNRKKR